MNSTNKQVYQEAFTLFEEKDYFEAACKIDYYADHVGYVSDELLNLYSLSILKMYNSDIVISEENYIYQKIDKLISSGNDKVANSIELSSDEYNAINLIKYYYSIHDSLKFGKHSGSSVKEIIEKNISYIPWCLIN